MKSLRLLLLAMLLSFVGSLSHADPIDVTAVARRLNLDDWNQTQVGRLVWRGGLQLTSNNGHFGGLSGLLISPDGKELVAVTDQGRWFTAVLAYDDGGDLIGLSDTRLGRLRGLDGEILEGKFFQDAESLAQLSDGSLLISFEHSHRILRYPPGPKGHAKASITQAPIEEFPLEVMARLPENDGIEALTHLDHDRILALTTEKAEPDRYQAYLWEENAWHGLSLSIAGEYKPTGAAWLPASGLIILERRFSLLGGVGARLRQIPTEDIQPGAMLEGEELAELKPPLIVDNMEGIALHQDTDGQVFITLLSDDNFNFLQQTLILMFELPTTGNSQNQAD